MFRKTYLFVTIVVVSFIFACGEVSTKEDAAPADSGVDQTVVDVSVADGPELDAMLPDSAPLDQARPDAPLADIASPDAAIQDATPLLEASPDMPPPDQMPPDLSPDLLLPDQAIPDLMLPDAMTPDISVPTAGTWVSTGNMTSVRIAHTSTLLKNGKVLVVGGDASHNKSNYLDTAELYDEKTGAFTLTGKMLTYRGSHSAALLNDGKVLLTGGMSKYANSAILDTAEVYDPATGKFTATGKMLVKRRWHQSITLTNGKVLIVGGDLGTGYHKSAELYDPKTGKFTATGSIKYPRIWFSADLLPDGKVVIVGGNGHSSTGAAAGVAELYDPNTGAWTSSGTMKRPRWIDTGTVLPDGTVLFAGGSYFSGGDIFLSSAEVFNPLKGTFAYVGSMTSMHAGNSATLLKNGDVLVAGGWNGVKQTTTSELFSNKTGKFTVTGSMKTPRQTHTSTLLNSGRVLVTGGRDDKNNYLKSAELYYPKAATLKIKQVEIDNTKSTSTLKDYQVQVTLDHKSLVSAGQSRTHGGDLRFFQGSTELPHWIEGPVNSTNTKIWVRVPSIAASAKTTLTMQYGDLSRMGGRNADLVFYLKDDFSGTILDKNKWSVQAPATATLSNGIVSISATTWTSGIWTKNLVSWPAPFVAEVRMRRLGNYDVWASFGTQPSGGTLSMADSSHPSNKGFLIYKDGVFGSSTKYSGTSTASFMVYQGIAYKKTWTAKRGATLNNLTATSSVSLSVPVESYKFMATLFRGGNKIEVDWIRVRAYTDVEPVVTVK